MNIKVTANAVPATEASSRRLFSVRFRQASGMIDRGSIRVAVLARLVALLAGSVQKSSAGWAPRSFESDRNPDRKPTTIARKSVISRFWAVSRMGIPASSSVAR